MTYIKLNSAAALDSFYVFGVSSQIHVYKEPT